ncbi:hypothetical protein LOK74_04505 [Brevibacillus humidisoli]|uniref:hypothetical protein n=1 Tax=Brevibacillus humidisoli TaxID=2895522 RepID=UPI001E2AEE08|nr:hypothetical protein [Brevibacillus humidisoli]UFJ43217.1 hypothetical protein LOK74_04505 [Brevibacillus humidisoli]
MLKKLIKSLLGSSSTSHKYRKYSSSDYTYMKRHHPSKHHGHSYYGKTHYKKKHSSGSFFSS